MLNRSLVCTGHSFKCKNIQIPNWVMIFFKLYIWPKFRAKLIIYTNSSQHRVIHNTVLSRLLIYEYYKKPAHLNFILKISHYAPQPEYFFALQTLSGSPKTISINFLCRNSVQEIPRAKSGIQKFQHQQKLPNFTFEGTTISPTGLWQPPSQCPKIQQWN